MKSCRSPHTTTEGLFDEVVPDIPQPINRGIMLADILEESVDDKYYLKPEVVENLLIHTQKQREKGNSFGAKFNKKNEEMQALKVGGKGVDDLVVDE